MSVWGHLRNGLRSAKPCLCIMARKGICEGLEGGNRREKWYNYILINKRKKSGRPYCSVVNEV